MAPIIRFTPAARRPRRKAVAASSPPPAPAAPVLVAAVYDHVAQRVTLTFDRAIDAALVVAAAVTVDDGVYTGNLLAADKPVAAIGTNAVRLPLGAIDLAAAADVRLTVAGTNNVRPAGGGSAWAGVSGLELPFQ